MIVNGHQSSPNFVWTSLVLPRLNLKSLHCPREMERWQQCASVKKQKGKTYPRVIYRIYQTVRQSFFPPTWRQDGDWRPRRTSASTRTGLWNKRAGSWAETRRTPQRKPGDRRRERQQKCTYTPLFFRSSYIYIFLSRYPTVALELTIVQPIWGPRSLKYTVTVVPTGKFCKISSSLRAFSSATGEGMLLSASGFTKAAAETNKSDTGKCFVWSLFFFFFPEMSFLPESSQGHRCS